MLIVKIMNLLDQPIADTSIVREGLSAQCGGAPLPKARTKDDELYQECSQRVWVETLGKNMKMRQNTEFGRAYRHSDGSCVKTVITSDVSSPDTLGLPGTLLQVPAYNSWGLVLPQLSRFAKELSSALRSANAYSLHCFTERKDFECLSDNGQMNRGMNEWAELSVHWETATSGACSAYDTHVRLASIGEFVNVLVAENPLLREIRSTLQSKSPWPAPRGQVGVLWSEKAVATLLYYFVRAFEGDVYDTDLSLLKHTKFPNGLKFAIEDHPRSAIDHEGTFCNPRVLFADGKPQMLAISKQSAKKLGLTPTGHARRESYRHPTAVVLWRTRLITDQTTDSFRNEASQGVFVKDICVRSFQPVTGEIELSLVRATLLHHGVEGELIRPVVVRTDIVTLLESFQLFSKRRETYGFVVKKCGQKFLMEIETPCAFSEKFDIPGEVPLSHYW